MEFPCLSKIVACQYRYRSVVNTHMGAGCVSVLFIVGFCEFSILILSLRLKDRQLKKKHLHAQEGWGHDLDDESVCSSSRLVFLVQVPQS